MVQGKYFRTDEHRIKMGGILKKKYLLEGTRPKNKSIKCGRCKKVVKIYELGYISRRFGGSGTARYCLKCIAYYKLHGGTNFGRTLRSLWQRE